MREVIQEWGVRRTSDVEVRGLCAYYDARLNGRPIGPDDAQSLYVGEQLFTIGFPISTFLGTEAKLTEGTVSALSGPGGEISFIRITAAVQPPTARLAAASRTEALEHARGAACEVSAGCRYSYWMEA